MGKHSMPKSEVHSRSKRDSAETDVTRAVPTVEAADTAPNAVTVPVTGTRRAALRAEREPETATGVLRTVNKRPVMAAIALPLAAGALVVGGGVAAGQDGGGEPVTVSAQDSVDRPDSKAPELDSEAEFTAKQMNEAEKKHKGSAKKKSEKASSELQTPSPESDEESGSSSSSDSSSNSSSDSSSSTASSGSASTDVSYPACNKSQSVEKHFQPNAKKVYRAVCAKFPEVSSYGGYRNDPGSDHGTGHAVDIMISSSTGDEIRDYAIKNKGKLGVKYVIWQQKIYASYTGWNGRPMEDRGSKTANHYDHVHVSVN